MRHVVQSMAELNKRLQREMRLRDLVGKESVPVGD